MTILVLIIAGVALVNMLLGIVDNAKALRVSVAVYWALVLAYWASR